MKFDSIGISRHRIGSDGVGVTTLIGGVGCPLDCAYCLNPQCKIKSWKSFTVTELFDEADKDSLYFSATNGGVCFGGGEPLLQAEFIRDFILFAKEQGRDWNFTLETCAAVPVKKLECLDGLIDSYIVDVKDMNEEIYKKYTGQNGDALRLCLAHLAKFPEKVKIRIPLIPGYNGKSDIENSKSELIKMGFSDFDVFKYRSNIEKNKILQNKGIDKQKKQ